MRLGFVSRAAWPPRIARCHELTRDSARRMLVTSKGRGETAMVQRFLMGLALASAPASANPIRKRCTIAVSPLPLEVTSIRRAESLVNSWHLAIRGGQAARETNPSRIVLPKRTCYTRVDAPLGVEKAAWTCPLGVAGRQSNHRAVTRSSRRGVYPAAPW